MLGFAPNMISYIPVTTYFYVHLAKDLTWTMLLGELDSTPTSWLHQQSPMTTSTSRERSTTHWRLLRLLISPTRLVGDDYTWWHAGDYFNYSLRLQDYLETAMLGDTLVTTLTTRFAYKTSQRRLCLTTRWWLLWLLISPTKLVRIDSSRFSSNLVSLGSGAGATDY
jgi:hypothetical protein